MIATIHCMFIKEHITTLEIIKVEFTNKIERDFERENYNPKYLLEICTAVLIDNYPNLNISITKIDVDIDKTNNLIIH